MVTAAVMNQFLGVLSKKNMSVRWNVFFLEGKNRKLVEKLLVKLMDFLSTDKIV